MQIKIPDNSDETYLPELLHSAIFSQGLVVVFLMQRNLQVVVVLPRTLLIYSICIRLRTLGTQLHDEVSKQVKAFVETQVKTRKAVLLFFLF